MPIYEYECEECHKVTEMCQSMSEAPLATCPECDGSVKKLISQSAFHLKGGGWYADGYSSNGNANTKSTGANSTEKKASCPNAASCPCAS
ncbi:MAG: FmdB family zinc ribbon protein [Thermodesulfobacteriota bacterium]